ncbi:MAG: efflux RND transporter periplasmic adaptor subunit [Gemmatimonadetes bacterium]|nr:efflux RND transporter periplasmic adaptor subunit [Gemmatimonadota bacterium]
MTASPRLLPPFTLLAATLLAGCSTGDAAPRPATEAIPVEVAAAEERAASAPVFASGLLAGKEEVTLAFKIGGVVQQARVESGQHVSAGEVLAELSPTEIGAEVEKARQGRDKAARDLERVKALYRDSVATLEQLQDATTGFDVAASTLRIAEFNRQYAVIRAPFAGTVLRRSVEANQLVAPGQAVLTLRHDAAGLVLRVGLPDRDAVRVAVGDRARVAFNAFPGERFSARVLRVAAAATAGAGTYEAELAVDPRSRPVASGLIGAAEIAARASGTYAFVPVGALIEADADSATVFVLAASGERAERRRVKVAFLDGAQVALAAGVARGERVVVEGASRLVDGGAVRVVSAAERGAK